MRMKSTEQETILVTGATGTLGSEVVKQLSRNKSDVKVKAAVHSIENAKKVFEHYFVGSTSQPQTKPNVTRILHGIYGDTED
jgi:FlaA1/EpsC-like NDP-sugar epimerase